MENVKSLRLIVFFADGKANLVKKDRSWAQG